MNPSNVKVGRTPLYDLLDAGVAVSGAPLLSESENHKALSDGNFSQQESWHSARSQFTAKHIEKVISSGPHSVLVDLADCNASEVKGSLIRVNPYDKYYESRTNKSLFEKLVHDIESMNPTDPGKLVLVVATECDRTKDSRHIQDKHGVQWSYIGDPSVAVYGLVPGETAFKIDKLEMSGENKLAAAMFKMEEDAGSFAERLSIILKKTLLVLADPNSYSTSNVLWSNFYSVVEVFALLKAALENNVLGPNFMITCHGPEERTEFSLKREGQGKVSCKPGEKPHCFVPDFCRAVEGFLNGEIPIPTRWSQENACMLAALFAYFGTYGYYAYKVMIYASFCVQMQEKSSLESESVLRSRVLYECFGRLPEFSWPEQLPRFEHSELVEKVLKGAGTVHWFGVSICEEDLGEAEGPFFDNDAKGCASTETLMRLMVLNGIKLRPGHGMPLRSGSDTMRCKIGGQRVELQIDGDTLLSSVRFQPHQLLDQLARLREIEVMTGKIVWDEETRDNGYYEVSNSLMNQLLAGTGGRKASMWVLSRIVYKDLAIKRTERTTSYCEGAREREDSRYEIEAPLDARVLAALHTYTDGREIWVDMKDNGELKKIVRGRGRLCRLVREAPGEDVELLECGVRSTLRIM